MITLQHTYRPERGHRVSSARNGSVTHQVPNKAASVAFAKASSSGGPAIILYSNVKRFELGCLPKKKAIPKMVPIIIWAPDIFGPREIWSPRNLGPIKLSLCIKMPYNDFHAWTKFPRDQISLRPNFLGTKSQGLNVIRHHFSYNRCSESTGRKTIESHNCAVRRSDRVYFLVCAFSKSPLVSSEMALFCFFSGPPHQSRNTIEANMNETKLIPTQQIQVRFCFNRFRSGSGSA